MRSIPLQMSLWALCVLLLTGTAPAMPASSQVRAKRVESTDVPESSTTSMFLLGLGMLALGALRRRSGNRPQ